MVSFQGRCGAVSARWSPSQPPPAPSRTRSSTAGSHPRRFGTSRSRAPQRRSAPSSSAARRALSRSAPGLPPGSRGPRGPPSPRGGTPSLGTLYPFPKDNSLSPSLSVARFWEEEGARTLGCSQRRSDHDHSPDLGTRARPPRGSSRLSSRAQPPFIAFWENLSQIFSGFLKFREATVTHSVFYCQTQN